MMAICGAQGRIKDKAYLHHIYCKVKNRINGEKQFIQLDQDVHVYGCDGYGKVDTRLRLGARYYHIYIGNVYLTHWVLNIIYHSGGGLLL
jgi:CO dehydrogenase/acetyl-CoA synthase epsilon subunit